MTHWGWYWRVKKKHTPKALCSQFTCLDSFVYFKQKGAYSFTVSNSKFSVEGKIEGDKFVVNGTRNYEIPIEKRPCRFGGFCYYLHCPLCNARMRKLYCCQGVFLCRKCLKLGYYCQRVSPCLRYGYMQEKVEGKLKQAGGDTWEKPKWMRKHTFERLKKLYWDYHRKQDEAFERETWEMFGCSVEGMFRLLASGARCPKS